MLVIGAFALMTFGTFLTRGSVLTSIHAFTESAVGPAYLAFLLLVLLGGFGLVAWRLPTLRSPAQLDSMRSREAAIIGNNVLLLAATAIILLGTVFPLVVEAVSGQQISVGKPYFEQAVAPVFLLLLLLVGTAPVLPWRDASGRSLARLRVPAFVAALVMAVIAVAGVRHVEAAAGFGLAALVLLTNSQEIITGVWFSARRRGLTAIRRSSRRYGGLLVHVGLAVLAAGVIASSGFAEQREITLDQGQSSSFAGYQLRYDGLTTDEQAQRTVLTARVVLTDRSGNPAGVLDPRLNLYPAASEPIGSPSIDRGVVWDLYASVVGLQENGRSATFRLYHNPGVNGLWLGSLLMVLGGAIAGSSRVARSRGRRADTKPAVEPATVAGEVP
jgi:cytochrome c-type biogenesis protein CcmF